MAYVAVNSLIYTVHRFLNSSHISILPPYREILIFAYNELQSLLQVLNSSSNESINKESVNVLDAEIRDVVFLLEDLLETNVSDHFLSQSYESLGADQAFSLTPAVISAIDSLTESLKMMKEAYINELSNPLPDEEEEKNDYVPLRSCFSAKKSKLIGLSDQFSTIRDELAGQSPYEAKVISLFGMAGIGKTTLAEKIFEDPSISSCFKLRAFVTIGPKYQLKEIIKAMLAQVRPNLDQMFIEGVGDAQLGECLYESLKGGTYLIVLDDVWTLQVLAELIGLFPEVDARSRVLLTTRLKKVAHSCLFWEAWRSMLPDNILESLVWLSAVLKNAPLTQLHGFHEIRFLSKQESWRLLHEKVFGEESTCPPELEKAGRKIAENCEGLPLTIVTIADILSKAEKTVEYWNNVAEKKTSVFTDAYDQMLKVLLPSYNNLPQQLKPCFLYMGVFPEKHEISSNRLIDLWMADGILELVNMSSHFAKRYVESLISCSLVMVRQRSYINLAKTFSLQSSFWYLCNKEAEKNKFFHALTTVDDGFTQGIESQRRLCIRNSILFAIKDVHNAIESISTARSLLCTGPYHQYPVPVCCGLMLLRILDALAIRFYEFPMEVLRLIHLRYFSLTYDGELPMYAISKLWNLNYLIVNPHLSIYGNSSYLHSEIWDMQELRHLQVIGHDLPDPREGSSLPNLINLLGVSALSCTEDVLRCIPNLQKLGIRIELPPDAEVPFSCFDDIYLLRRLTSLKCVIVNPIWVPQVVIPPIPLLIFSASLTKLTLSGFGYPWKEMGLIAALPNLYTLKLRCNAFQGPKWETIEGGFPELRYLLIEDIDLVHWTIGSNSFASLRSLSLRHCYKLKEMPRTLERSLFKIEVVDCNPVVVRCAKQIKEEEAERGIDFIEVNVQSSWEG